MVPDPTIEGPADALEEGGGEGEEETLHIQEC